MEIEQTGNIKLKKVLKEVASKYKIKKEDIVVTSSNYKNTVEFKFDIVEDKKYEITKNISLDFKDIEKIVLDILNKDNIKANNITLKFKHIEGDSFEPLDYGRYELKGFNFNIVK